MIPKTLDYGPFFHWLKESPLGDWGDTLPDLIAHQLRPGRWGDMPEWEETLRRLPEIDPLHVNFEQSVQIGDISLMDKGRRLALQATLMGLHPWRKGPYNLFGLPLDTEWRSDWKWDRVLPHLSSLQNRLILDVGCGNGYHCFRMLGAGAKVRVGDPQGHREGKALLPGVDWCTDIYLAAQDADLIVILTEWNEFRALNLERLSQGMSMPRLADLRNIYSADEANKAGFKVYVSVGR